MFVGQYTADIDQNGRVLLPRAFGNPLQGGLVVTRGLDRALLVFAPDAWEVLAKKLAAQALTDPDVRALRRRMFAAASRMEVDDDGRFVLPRELREFAQLGRTVVMAGMYDHFEIWTKEAWTIVEADAEGDGQGDRWRPLGI